MTDSQENKETSLPPVLTHELNQNTGASCENVETLNMVTAPSPDAREKVTPEQFIIPTDGAKEKSAPNVKSQK